MLQKLLAADAGNLMSVDNVCMLQKLLAADAGNLMSVDNVCMLQQLLAAGKSRRSTAATDEPTRLLRQLLFPASDCRVVCTVGPLRCSTVTNFGGYGLNSGCRCL